MKEEIKNLVLGKNITVDYAKPIQWVREIEDLGIDSWNFVFEYSETNYGKPVHLGDALLKKICADDSCYLILEVLKEILTDKNKLFKISELLYDMENRC